MFRLFMNLINVVSDAENKNAVTQEDFVGVGLKNDHKNLTTKSTEIHRSSPLSMYN